MLKAPTGFLPKTGSSVIDLTESGDVAQLLFKVLDDAGAEKIELICQTSGGWEGWLQCELAWLMKSGNRESKICGDAQRTDLVWYRGEARPLSIELKAIGLARDPGQFLKECAKDLEKLKRIVGNYIPVAAVVVPNWPAFETLKRELKDLGEYTEYRRGNCTLYVKG